MDNFEKGNLLYKNKQYNDAIKTYTKALYTSDNSASVLYNIGVCFIKLNKYFEAINFFEKALLEKQEGKYYYNLAYCHIKINNPRAALRNFNTAWALNNNDEECKKAIDIILKHYYKNMSK
ncbi:tetratricopeptide repeat protein [Clostridium sp. DL1XJH146]